MTKQQILFNDFTLPIGSQHLPRWKFGVFITLMKKNSGRRGGFMVSALVSGSSGPGSSPGRGHCVVFLGKTLYSHSASLHPVV